MSDVKLEDLVSLAKRRGFIFQGSEIYGGIAGFYDYGPLGVQLKRNVIDLWWKTFVENRDDMYGVDAAIIMNAKVWEASGHVSGFNDPLVECSNCHARLREDHVKKGKCTVCGKKDSFSEPRQFNMMFDTFVGPAANLGLVNAKETANKLISEQTSKGLDYKTAYDGLKTAMLDILKGEIESTAYLRPETAQGIFTNFKNVVDTYQPDLPFGIAQVGKAFRNEISPRDFTFRTREFEQMEIEYFVEPSNWEEYFNAFVKNIYEFLSKVGIGKEHIHELDVPEGDRAHYSKRTIDFEFDYPFGKSELLGLAYRTNYDLNQHQKHSGKNLEYTPKSGGKPFLPHVIEPSFGVDRLLLAVLTTAYCEDTQNNEKRIYLKLPANIAPVKVAVFPLLKNKPELVKKAREVYDILKKNPLYSGGVMFDDNGNIGKRYRRQDEIGTPYCVTIDFDTLENDTVTVRNRDTTKQERVKISELGSKIS